MHTQKRALDEDVQNIAFRVLESLDTPISLGVYLRMKYGEWVQLASKQVDPMQYLDCCSTIEKFRRDYQAVSLLRKYEGLPIKAKDRKSAIEMFYESERQCHFSNCRLSQLEYPIGIPHVALEFLHRLRKIVASLLGPIPVTLDGRFGPGTAFEFSGRHKPYHRTISGKLMQAIYCTPAAAPVAENIIRPTWWGCITMSVAAQSGLRYLRGNRFTTVPKDAMKDRGICVEPGGNVFCQLAVGRHIRSRLFRVAKLNLDKGQPIHQRMAWEGSLTQKYATIDLSNASDTISSKFVELALGYCPEWFLLLSSLRSPMTRVTKNKWVWLEKFSSMGNGFTFELETLLFYAVSLAAANLDIGDPDVKVYGDDIIVPTEVGKTVSEALIYMGFILNPRKTFLNGPFRESCGGDFFLGQEVTPFYIKKVPELPSDWITIANGLWSRPFTRKVGLFARRFIGLPGGLPIGPREFGDVVLWDLPSKWKFHDRSDEWDTRGDTAIYCRFPRYRHCSQIRWLRAWVPIPGRIPLDRYPEQVQLASALYGVPSDGPSPRDDISGYRYVWLAYG